MPISRRALLAVGLLGLCDALPEVDPSSAKRAKHRPPRRRGPSAHHRDHKKRRRKHNDDPVQAPKLRPAPEPEPRSAPAPALPDPTPVLAALASQQTHGWSDDIVPLDHLEQQLAAGQRIIVSCGTIARLGVRALLRAGYTARLVGSLTRDPYDGSDDGHIMLEVVVDGAWRVYDLDLNHQAINELGQGISVIELVASHPRHWRVIADDPLLSDEALHSAWGQTWVENVQGWYDHILGIPTIEDDGTWWFHDDGERSRAESLGFQYANADAWQALLSTTS